MKSIIPIEQETRPTVDTVAAAHYLNIAPQTLRLWSCKGNGPIKPIRIGHKLHWRTSEIRHLLGGAA